MKCYKCKSSNVQRYQVIHEQGTSNININSSTAGGGIGFGGGLRGGLGYAKTGSSGKTQTLIAEKTKPPRGDHTLSLLILTSIIIIPLLVPTGYGWGTLIGLLAIGMVPCIKINQAEERKLQERLNTYDKTWYCNKCGNSFVSK